jgi:hypothetical protein
MELWFLARLQGLCLFTASVVSKCSDPGARIAVDGNQPRSGLSGALTMERPRTKDSVGVGTGCCLGLVHRQGGVTPASGFRSAGLEVGDRGATCTQLLAPPIVQQECIRYLRHTMASCGRSRRCGRSSFPDTKNTKQECLVGEITMRRF